MKTVKFILVLVIITTVSCGTKKETVAPKIDFGIYEMSVLPENGTFDPNNMSKTIGIEQIRKTKVKGTEVLIYFTMDGAKKWAEMTKRNIGETIAFVIDGNIVSTPTIAAEIREGVAKLSGLTDESQAKSISESLNAGIGR